MIPSHMLILPVTSCTVGVLFRNSLPTALASCWLHVTLWVFFCFSRSSQVFVLIPGTLIRIQLIFILSERDRSSFNFLQMDIRFSSTICLKKSIFSPTYILNLFSRIMVIIVWVHFRVPYSITLVYMSLLIPVPCCFRYYSIVI